ncbi:MAG: hypothetical protein V1676_00085 [Candidatus Diapherotrites archaeon]
MEESEIKLVIESILQAIKEENTLSEIVEDKNPFAATIFGKLLDQGLAKLPNADLIITNSEDSHKFFWLDRAKFKPNYQREQGDVIGTYVGVRILVSRRIPYGATILTKARGIGEFIIKKDIDAKISEIKDAERQTLKQTLNLTEENLDGRVRLLVDETIQFSIKDPKQAVLIETAQQQANVAPREY